MDTGWGFVNKDGVEVISCTLPEAGYFHQGVARIRHAGKYGLLDVSGRWVLPPDKDFLSVPSSGFISFREKGKWGFVDTQGQEVLAAQYEGAMAFSAAQ